MNEESSWESGQNFNFLDKDSKVSFEIEPEALANLPTISVDDTKTGHERFRVLLGTFKIRSPQRAHIIIKGVYEDAQDDTYGTYEEGVEHVIFSPRSIGARLQEIRDNNLEYKDFQYLGDVHTHPISSQPHPSEGDLSSAIEQYSDGVLSSQQPYIFGIAARRRDGEMEYNFYRMVRSGSEYYYTRLDFS